MLYSIIMVTSVNNTISTSSAAPASSLRALVSAARSAPQGATPIEKVAQIEAARAVQPDQPRFQPQLPAQTQQQNQNFLNESSSLRDSTLFLTQLAAQSANQTPQPGFIQSVASRYTALTTDSFIPIRFTENGAEPLPLNAPAFVRSIAPIQQIDQGATSSLANATGSYAETVSRVNLTLAPTQLSSNQPQEVLTLPVDA